MNSWAAPQGRAKPPRSRRPLAAVVLFQLVLLVFAAVKLLPQQSTQQPAAVQQLLSAAGCLNVSLGGDVGAARPSAFAAPDAQHAAATATPSSNRSLRVLMLGHDLTLSGAPLGMMEIARHLRDQGHTISLLFLRGGHLEETLTREAFNFSVIGDVQVHPYNRSAPVDPASFDVVVVNTIVTFHWLRYQVEAWGLNFLRKTVWWIREHPRGPHHNYIAEGPAAKRHILSRCGSAAIVSETTWRFYEHWVLERAFEMGLDYSPLVGRQESFGPVPPLPAALPNLRIVRNPLPPWIMPLLEAGAGGRGFTRLPECNRASPEWPHAALRQHFRQRINATDEDYVLILVGTNVAHKGTARLVATFARAWQQVGSMSGRSPGRLLLVCIGQDMLLLDEEVKQAWAGLQPTGQLAGAAEAAAAQGAHTLPAAIHLLNGTTNSTERLGWYAAADVQVLNSECESFGRVTVEGMAVSLPLLATACGGTLELVQDGVTGLLHPSPSAGEASDAALLQHILRLDRRTASGRALGERLGAAGCRRTHSEFLPRQFLATVEALLQHVAGSAAVADAAAAAGLGVAPSEGLAPGAAGPLPSGWAAAFMPTPANQARVMERDMQWTWEEQGPAPMVASESAGFQVGNKLFILGGDVQYLGGAGVVPQALVSFDLGSRQWQNESVALPAELAETHTATALVGGRHLFIVSGQKGSECSPATTAAFRLDLQTMRMQPIPNLPEPRYSPALAMLDDGRLHLFGGLMPDRATPARDHWSLAVNEDGSTGDAWVAEPLLPAYLGGSHGTVVPLHPGGEAEPTLYYWGRTSQEAQPRDAAAGDFFCVANRKWGDAALWSFNLRRGWRRHRDLPLPLLHTSGCTVKLGKDTALVVGGQHYSDWLSSTLWLYNATEDSWTRVGHAPVYNRGHVCGLHEGRLYMALGQQGKHDGLSYQPGTVSGRQFWALLPHEMTHHKRV